MASGDKVYIGKWDASSQFYVFDGATLTYFGSPPGINTWVHLVATYDGVTLRLYQNGVAAGTRAVTYAFTVGNMQMGVFGASYYPHKGLVDDPCMWSRALDASEVASLYNSGSGIETMTGSLLTGLTHQWHLNGSSVDQLGQASLAIGALNARTSAVCADPNPSRCR
jgi:hypothetical protein